MSSVLSFPRFARVVLTFLITGACSAQLPRADGTATAPTDAPWPVDGRPVSDTCRALAKPPVAVAPQAKIAYQAVTSAKLKELVDIVPHAGKIYVVEKEGRIRYLAPDGKTAPLVMDISSALIVGYDWGLMSFAFHPQFATNGYVYATFNVPHPQQPPPPNVVFQSILARFQSKDGGLTIDPTTEKRLLTRDQPNLNHGGNKVAFGNDGYLYYSVGDGSRTWEESQKTTSLFGKVLRFDVDSGDPYGIPPTNPFAGGGGAPEVYAYGLRNPWRFNFDRVTGDLWLGDVGNVNFEEIDRIVLGGNYGWSVLEGRRCNLAPTCDPTGFVDPVVVHEHDGTPDGAAAIIGGVVYRGNGVPELKGKYVYSDYVSSNWWMIDPAPGAKAVPVRLERGLDRVGPVSIDLDADGEIVFVTHDGKVLRVVQAPALPPPEMAANLSGTGCVDKADPTKPSGGLFAYDVNVPQWNDGAVADRFVSVPPGTTIGVGDRGVLELPPGSVAIRTLRKESKLVETQMLLRRPDASWSAYTYAWAADQKDAVLVDKPTTVALPNGAKHLVKPAECVGCHDAHGHVTLGLEAGQLERGGVDQRPAHTSLATLAHVGLIAAPVAPESFTVLPQLTGYDTDERRARAYLHASCSSCHDGQDKAMLDLRITAPRPDAQACAILTTMRSTGPDRQPPIGATTPDETALRALAPWVASFRSCP